MMSVLQELEALQTMSQCARDWEHHMFGHVLSLTLRCSAESRAKEHVFVDTMASVQWSVLLLSNDGMSAIPLPANNDNVESRQCKATMMRATE